MIITFYSYKGGVGRSMALANVAEILADVGYDVILCDFDLEAPGLERYMSDDEGTVRSLRASRGVIDLLEEYKDVLATPEEPEAYAVSREGFTSVNGLALRRPSSYAREIRSQNSARLGRLRFLGAGCREGSHALRYSESVQNFDWSDFYARWAGAAYIDFFREDLTSGQTVVLVDSRTGVTEHGGVCTHHLADLVVLISAANDINIEGTKWMADLLKKADIAVLRKNRRLQVMPVAGRVEISSQAVELEAFRQRFDAEFAGAVPGAAGDGAEFIHATEIPYIPYFAFTEKVVARQTSTSHRELFNAYEALTRAIVNVGLEAQLLTPPQRPDWADARWVAQAELKLSQILERHRRWVVSEHAEGERAVLRGHDFSRQVLPDVELGEADLSGARCVQSDLHGAHLGGATLRGATLSGATLDQGNLTGADLREADLANASLRDATLDLGNFTDADIEAADAAGATWRGALLAGARLDRANLFGADLTDADLTGATLLGTDIRSANLVRAIGLDGGELSNAIIDAKTRLPAGIRPGSQGQSAVVPDRRHTAEFVPVAQQREYPLLSEDFRFLEQRLMPHFRSVSNSVAAYRSRLLAWHSVVITLVAVSAVLAGGSYANFLANGVGQFGVSASFAWVAFAAGVLAAGACASLLSRPYRGMAERYDDYRLIAERLEAEYFLFLGRVGEYAESPQRHARLERRVGSLTGGGKGP